MDSSNAEKTAQQFHEVYERLAPSFGYKTREASAVPWSDVPAQNKALMAAVAGEVLASRDAEVAELTRLLAESRAANGDSEARRAELEAVIEQLRDEANAIIDTSRENGTDFERGQENLSERVFDVLAVHPSVVLEDRDREVAARALEDFAARAERMFAGTDGTDKERAWIGGVRAVALRLRQRAAAIRKGDTA
jgi:hypothetical protein